MSVSGLLLTDSELRGLTGTKQPKRMVVWLSARGWIFEAPTRRGELPKVGRAYAESRMAGQPIDTTAPRRVAASADWMLTRSAA